MNTTGIQEPGDMERLVTRWRNNPWDLRTAVMSALQVSADLTSVLPSRGTTRLLPAIGQKVVYSAGPADTLLVTLVLADEPSYIGIVSHVAIHTANELEKLLRAFNKALAAPSGKPSATARPTKLRQARLQVVLPPDVFMERPPIVENVPLARALYAAVEVDQEIPQEHYKAVAEVISYVMRLKGKRIAS